MKSLLISITAVLAPSLSVASAQTESFALKNGPRWSLDVQAGSFAALSGFDAAQFSSGLSESNGAMLGDSRGSEFSVMADDRGHRWNPEVWDTGHETHRFPDGDSDHFLDDDGWRRASVGVVPEPSSWLMLACGAAVVMVRRSRRI